MAKGKSKLTIEIEAKGGPSLKKNTAEVNRQSKAIDRLDKANKRKNKNAYGGQARQKQAIIQTANSTKNFSKMSQAVDGGGGGTGGLVRAYALLAANVFALSAAFGILSRAAQVDNLIKSMEQLEVVSGRAILQTARNLQEAAGFGMDYAESMRAASLATSAGFGGEQITELAKVARNAAVSLGRNVPDALDRIFRGVIKVEPELLDEIGLFVRVKEASAKYAATIGKSASDLTEFEKRQAFLNEALEQGKTKFAAFEDVNTDAYTLLATTFSDMTQTALTFLNSFLEPIIRYLTENKLLLSTLFSAAGIALIRLVIPAMGKFTSSIAANAAAAQKSHADYVAASAARVKLNRDEHNAWLDDQKEKMAIRAREAMAVTQGGAQGKLTVGGKKQLSLEKGLNKDLLNQKTGMVNLAARRQMIEERISQMMTKQGVARKNLSASAKEELLNLEAELVIYKQIDAIESKRGAKIEGRRDKEISERKALKLKKNAITSAGLASVAAAGETQGFWASLKAVNEQLNLMDTRGKKVGVTFTGLNKVWFAAKAGATAAGVAFQGMWMKLMGPLSFILMILPVITWALKKFGGIGSEVGEDLSKANTEASDAFSKLSRRIKHAKEQMMEFTNEDLTAGQQAQAYNVGAEAFAQGVLTTTKALEQQIKAFKEYEENAHWFAQWWGETLPKAFGGGTENKIVQQQEALVKEIEAAAKDNPMISEKMTKALDTWRMTGEDRGFVKGQQGWDDWQKEIETARKAVIDLAETEANALKVTRSAIDGAKEAAKDFTNSLIISTDVDKPLSTFRQLASALDDAAMTDLQRQRYAKEISEDTAIQALLTREQRDYLKSTTEQTSLFRDKLKEIVKLYRDQQNFLITSQTTLQKITAIQKVITNLTKESTKAIKLKYELERQSAEINIKVAQIESRNTRTQTNMTASRIAQLSMAEDMFELLSKEESTKENLALIQAAITAHRKEEILLMKEAFASATRELRTQQDIANIALQRLTIEEKLNSLRLEGFKNEQKIAAFMKRGTIKLDPAEELKATIEAEKVRMKTGLASQKLELHILDLKNKIILEEWKLLWAQSQDAEHKKIVLNRKAEELRVEGHVKRQRREANLALGRDPSHKDSITQTQYDNLMAELDSRIEAVYDESEEIFKKHAIDAMAGEDALDNFTASAKMQAEIINQTFDNMAGNYLVSLLGVLEKMKSKGGSGLVGIMGGTAMQSLNRMRGTRDFLTEAGAQQGIEGGKMDAALAGARGIKAKAKEDDRELLPKELEALKLLQKGYYDAKTAKEAWAQAEGAAEVQLFTNAIRDFSAAVASLGEEGMLAATMADFGANLIETFEMVDFKTGETADKLAAVAGIIAGIGNILAANSRANIANIDREIAAEQKRDGKSKASLAKIKAMEAKKDKMARKAFEQNKKIQMANAIMSTAATIAGIMAHESPKIGPYAVPLAFAIGALGAAQVAIISKMQYQGAGSETASSTPPSINIGERGSGVDVSQKASLGELAFLRGVRGRGTSATAFTPTGGASGLRKGYADGGEILVGERGPETITPLSPMQVWPSDMGAKSQINANFTIHAIDAAGVEDVLLNQQGNIISMIRSAANDHGEEFLEAINVDMYGEPKSAGGIDY